MYHTLSPAVSSKRPLELYANGTNITLHSDIMSAEKSSSIPAARKKNQISKWKIRIGVCMFLVFVASTGRIVFLVHVKYLPAKDTSQFELLVPQHSRSTDPPSTPSSWHPITANNHSTSTDNNNSNNNNNKLPLLHPFTSLLVAKKNVFLLQFRHENGFGSLMISTLLLSMFFHDTQGRHLVVDESKVRNYRRNNSSGVFTGFFDTTFPVLDNDDDYNRVEQEMKTHGDPKIFQSKRNWRANKKNIENPAATADATGSSISQPPVLQISMHDGWRQFGGALYAARSYYKRDMTAIFPQLSSRLCESIVLNPASKQEIQDLLTSASIPDFTATTTTTTGTPNKDVTIAFHIRRGDKVVPKPGKGPSSQDSRPYKGAAYVDKLLQVIQNSTDSNLSRIRHCFVATDDYRAVVELQDALKEQSINCTLHTLTTPTYHTTRDANDIILFLAEMKMLIDATYFFGTFHSNVGKLVALYRACNRTTQEERGNVKDNYNHFAHSYGIDEDKWYV
jgi:hypothetical protein